MKKIFVFLFLVISFCCFSQQEKIDSLLFKIKTSKNNKVKIKKLNELSRFYIYYSPQKAIKYANRAYALSQESSYQKGVIQSKLNLGFYYLRVDNYKQARVVLREAFGLAQKTRDRASCGEACYLLARVNNGLGRYDFSMNKLILSEKYYDSIGLKKYMGRVYETMGDLNDKFGNYDLALENLQKSLTLKKRHNDLMELPRTYAYLGNVNLHKKQNAIALRFYKKGLSASIKIYNLNSKGYCLTKLGDFYLITNQFKKARAFYEKSLIISNDHQNNWGIFRNELGLSKSDFKLKLYVKSREMALKAIQIAEKIKDEEGLMEGYKLLSQIYEKTGQIKEAYESFKKSSAYEKDLFDKEKTAEITMNEITHKQDKKTNNLKEEKRQQELKQKQKDQIAQKDRERKEQIGIILIVFLIIVILFSIFQYNRYIAIKKQKQIIQNKTNQNLILMKTLSNQDKMSTVGEISSNIAHELNSPLGTVKSSAEGIEYSFKNIIKNKHWGCSSEEIDKALEYVIKKQEKGLLTGKKRIKKSQVFLDFLNNNHPNISEKKQLADLFASTLSDPSEKSMIEYVLKVDNPVSFLKLLKSINLVLFFIDANISSSKRVSNRVMDLRSYLMTDKKEKKQKINISKNIETIIDLFKHELDKEISFTLTLDDSIHLNAFPVMLHQLWSNLLKNAIEALKQNPKEKEIEIKLYSTTKKVIVEFNNNGPQIEEEDKNKIFENLYTTKTKSAGLGLGIVKNVVDAHQAEIEFESNTTQTGFKIIFYKS